MVMGITGMYGLLTDAQRFSDSTGNKIQAIQIAREWIEAIINIRDTNALLFSWDMRNCWNVVNYNAACIWTAGVTNDIRHWRHYAIYPDVDNRWKLTLLNATVVSNGYQNSVHRSTLWVNLDTNGLYTQNWWTPLKPTFTRKLYMEYIDTNTDTLINENDEKLRVTSTVEWGDSSSQTTHTISLTTILSNWKAKF